MDVDALHEVSDTSRETLLMLSQLIEASQTEEQLVYRETEIDELWRLIATEKKFAGGAQAAKLARAMDVVMEVHDLIGISSSVAAAAATLRTLAID